MKTGFVALLLVSCAHRAPAPVAAPLAYPADPSADLCSMVFETIDRALGQEDDSHLGESCVLELAGVNGVAYAEAVGFDPMPVDTITCKSAKWVVRIGQTPPQAPTKMILFVGFHDNQRGDVRDFNTYVQFADWRKRPGHFPMNACGLGGVDGVVRRRDGRWVATMKPAETS